MKTTLLRAEDGLYNFTNALKQFVTIIDSEEELKKEGFSDFYLDIFIKRFEFTYEMSWKALKRYLEFLGIKVKSPRMSFKEGFIQGLINDEYVWLDMIEQRNLSSHIYDRFEIEEITKNQEEYKKAFFSLKKNIEDGLKNL